MEKIDALAPTTQKNDFENSVVADNAKRKRLMHSFFNNAGIFLGVFIMFAVVVIVTTDVRLITFEEWAAFALDFFLLLFCSYSMYITCSDSGMRAGLRGEIYTAAIDIYDEHKKTIVTRQLQPRLYDFCRNFIETELRNARMAVLANVGFIYRDFEENWLGKDTDTIEKEESLSGAQKKALIAANAIAPIHLTPDMILKRGRGGGRRAPLGLPPELKKRINLAIKLVTSLITAFAVSLIALDIVMEPTWTIFATCCIKLLTVAINGFWGYKYGYENIVVDTVNYINDQVDLMKQAEQFCEKEDALAAEKAAAEREAAAPVQVYSTEHLGDVALLQTAAPTEA